MNSLSDMTALGSLSSSPSSTAPASAAPAASSAPASSDSTRSSPTDFLTGKIAQVAIILLGLLFIAAALFTFDKTKEIIVTAGKTAGKAAAIAA